MAAPEGFSRSRSLGIPQSVGLLWTSDRPEAETSTWQQTIFITDKHPRPPWDSNPQTQQASSRRPTPYTVRPLESALYIIMLLIL